MGLFTPRGDEDEEDGDIQLSGMEHLDGPPGGGDDEITFELDEWNEPDRAVLAERLVTLGAPHHWEGTTLVIAQEDEAWVERIMDQVDEDLSTAPEEDDDEQVAYDLTDWDDESCIQLLDVLSAEESPYGLDGDELLVASSDEARVDEIVDVITTPGATLRLGGPASFEAMSELFVAADVLSKDPTDNGATSSLVAGARAAAQSTAPYGMEPAWWDGVVARAGALADLVAGLDPDHDQIADLASALRNELRPVI